MAHTSLSVTPDTDLFGKVRTRDEQTSWGAAMLQTRTKTQRLAVRLHKILYQRGPKTDDELCAAYNALHTAFPDEYEAASPQSIRSRRSELCTNARARWTGQKRPSNMGGPSNVWEALEWDRAS